MDIEPVGSGHAVLKYLAPYVYRIAISDHRLVKFDDDEVTYKIKPSGEKRYRERSVESDPLRRRLLATRLAGRVSKDRYYGWQSPNHRLSLDEIRWLVMIHLGLTFVLNTSHRESPEAIKPLVSMRALWWRDGGDAGDGLATPRGLPTRPTGPAGPTGPNAQHTTKGIGMIDARERFTSPLSSIATPRDAMRLNVTRGEPQRIANRPSHPSLDIQTAACKQTQTDGNAS